MNGNDPQRNHVKYVVTCITVLGIVCGIGGVVLIYKGYNGDLLIGGTLAAISGLVGMLAIAKPQQSAPDVTISGQPPKVELTQPQPKVETIP